MRAERDQVREEGDVHGRGREIREHAAHEEGGALHVRWLCMWTAMQQPLPHSHASPPNLLTQILASIHPHVYVMA